MDAEIKTEVLVHQFVTDKNRNVPSESNSLNGSLNPVDLGQPPLQVKLC